MKEKGHLQLGVCNQLPGIKRGRGGVSQLGGLDHSMYTCALVYIHVPEEEG